MKLFKYRILNHILFWIFIFTFYTIPYILSSGFKLEAFINLLYIPFDIITVYIVIEFLIPQFLFKKRKIIFFLVGAVTVIGINIIIAQFLKYTIQPAIGFWTIRKPLTHDLFYGLLNNFMIVGTASALKLFSYSYTIQLTKSELERKTVQSELGILRSQINPHFLFNVLNNIDSLIYEDKEKASNAIFQLSKIMRYMLQESPHEIVKLDKEITYIKDYLDLAKLSFEDPNFLNFSINGSFSDKQISPLLFIPLIENAVKHCNKKSEKPGIQIHFTIEKNYIELKTSNYIKRNDFKLPDNSTGTGLKNVERRLKLLYEENYIFDITQDMDKFDVYLKVPLS
ncbi:MAG: histidine kinase [Bacteroidetes bacterium]|nr:histidine kinase [Bacteroidota bacterium]